MSCNCKKVNNNKEFIDAVSEIEENDRIGLWNKIKISFVFVMFHSTLMITSIYNFMLHDNLAPKIPNNMVKLVDKTLRNGKNIPN